MKEEKEEEDFGSDFFEQFCFEKLDFCEDWSELCSSPILIHLIYLDIFLDL